MLPELEVGRVWIRVATVLEELDGSFEAALATEVEAEAGVDEPALVGLESSSSVVAVAESEEAAFQTDIPVGG